VTAGRLLIRGGTVIDGSGGDPYVADVLLADGIIAAIGPNLAAESACGPVARQLDAAGLLVTPGFVDVHTHYDGQATWEHTLGPSSGHGVTTVVMGNCGVGFAPCRPQSRDSLVRLMEGIEDIPEIVMTEGLPWAWQTFPEYLDFLGARSFDVDLAAQLPHAALRVYVMGKRGMAREPATETDMAQMRELAQEAMAAGAVGFSTSRSVNHKTVDGELTPSFDAAERELYAIADGLARSGRGVLQVITEFPAPDLVPDRMRLLVGLARASGRPLSFTLAQFHSAPRSWPEVLRLTEEAHAAGVPIRGQVFPRPMGLLMGLDTSRNPFSASPSYQALAGLPVQQRAAAMRSPDLRARIIAESDAAGVKARQRDFDWVFPLRCLADYEPGPGDSIAALARARGVSPAELAYDVMLERDGRGLLWAGFANIIDGSLEPALTMMKSPATIIGLGDGGAHYGLICDSSFPTFLLSYWGRERSRGERLPLPSIVKSLTSDPAAAVGLNDRGLIRAGYKADLNLIDFDSLTLHMPQVRHDLPSGGRRLTQAAEGYRATIVSGAVTYRDGQPTGDLPGRLVRGPRQPSAA
jgi:N-acyl-D-aspartate/D-glutamate deacylase